MREFNQGDVKSEANVKMTLSHDNFGSVMMQRWQNESMLDQPYNSIAAVNVQNGGK